MGSAAPDAALQTLEYGSLFRVLFVAFALGAPPGLAAAALLSGADRRERLLWRLAAPGMGLFLFSGLLGALVWSLGMYRPWLGHAAWLGLTLGLGLWAARRLSPAADLAALGLALALAAALGLLIYSPVRGLPASPDYDGTADGYLAGMVKLGGSYPRLDPLGDGRSVTVNVPPAVPVLGAYVSELSGVYVARTQLALSGAAWILYTLVVPVAAWYLTSATSRPLAGVVLATVLSYSLSMKWNYYDGSNIRLHAMLGLMVVTALWLRHLAGQTLPGALVGGALGLLIYLHHRYLLFGAITIGLFLLVELLRQAAGRRWGELRRTLRWSAAATAGSALVALPFLLAVLPYLFVTQNHPMWSSPRLEGMELLRYLQRFQGLETFVAALVASLLVLFVGWRRPCWRYVGLALLTQYALLSDALVQRALPFLRGYLDSMAVALSGFSDVRPLALGAALLLPVDWVARRHRPGLARVTLVVVLAVVAGRAVLIARAPIPSCYTHLTRGDFRALSWLRENTPRRGTLVLAYAWDDIPDEELKKWWVVDKPRDSFTFESFWVTAVAERRSVFHWLNRHMHQRSWNVIAHWPSGYVAELVALNKAYLHPDEAWAEPVMRRSGVTHLFLTPLMHMALHEKLSRARYLRLRFLDSPPFPGFFGRPDFGYVPTRPEQAAAVYELNPPAAPDTLTR